MPAIAITDFSGTSINFSVSAMPSLSSSNHRRYPFWQESGKSPNPGLYLCLVSFLPSLASIPFNIAQSSQGPHHCLGCYRINNESFGRIAHFHLQGYPFHDFLSTVAA
jgi:hypothetical protein